MSHTACPHCGLRHQHHDRCGHLVGDLRFRVGQRVELHPGTDRWMMGDRYGNVVSVNAKKGTAKVKLDRSGKTLAFHFDRLMEVH